MRFYRLVPPMKYSLDCLINMCRTHGDPKVLDTSIRKRAFPIIYTEITSSGFFPNTESDLYGKIGKTNREVGCVDTFSSSRYYSIIAFANFAHFPNIFEIRFSQVCSLRRNIIILRGAKRESFIVFVIVCPFDSAVYSHARFCAFSY